MFRVLSVGVSLALVCACGGGTKNAPHSNVGGTNSTSGGASNSGGSGNGGSGNSGMNQGGNAGANVADGGTAGPGVGGNSGAGGSGIAGAAGAAGCEQGILVLLDSSLSMVESELPSSGAGAAMTRWEAAVNALDEVIGETDAAIPWGLKLFPTGEPVSCHVDSVAPGVDVPFGPAEPVLLAIAGKNTFGSGTPTAQAMEVSVTYLSSLASPSPPLTLLVTDGIPSCACLSEIGSDCDDSATARPLTEQSLGEAAAAGFRTVVVGIGPSPSTSDALNRMARAGGAVRSGNPLGSAYLADYHESLAPVLRAAIERALSICAGNDGNECPAAGNTIVSEDFESEVVAPLWISEPSSGGWSFVTDGANRAYQTDSLDEAWLVGGNAGCGDQALETKVRFATTDGERALLAIRVTDLETYYFVELRNAGDQADVLLRKRANGSTSDLSPRIDVPPFAAGTWHSLRFSAVGSELRVSFDGTEVLTGSDADISAGGIALGGDSAGIAFDDVVVTANP